MLDTLAVGCPGAGPRDGSIARGLVAVRDRQANGGWLPVWSGEGPAGQANYGDAVAIHGDLLAVAAHDVSTYEGRVSVLRRQGQAYALDLFGAGLDGQGKLLGVGAPGLTYGYGAVLYSVGDWNLMA